MSDILLAGFLPFSVTAVDGLPVLTLAYVGPAGIGTLGVLVVVLIVLLVGVAGLVLYPVRAFLQYRRSQAEQQGEPVDGTASTASGNQSVSQCS